MKTWIRRSLIGLAAAAVLATGLGAWAHRHSHDRHGPVTAEQVAEWRGKFIDRASSELALDANQQQRLGVLFDKMNEQRTALMAGTAPPREMARGLIAGDKFDRSKATALVEEKTTAIRGKSPEVIAAMGDFYDSLNAEQQGKVRQFLDRRGGRHGEHRGG